MKKDNLSDQYQVNDEIRAKEVRIVGEGFEPRVVSLREALQIADNMELDLVMISPNAVPPVCRIVDFSKFIYQLKKKQKEAKAKQLACVIGVDDQADAGEDDAGDAHRDVAEGAGDAKDDDAYDFLDDLDVGCRTFAGAFEVNDVNMSHAEFLEVLNILERIVTVDGHLVVVALEESYDLALIDINCGNN